MRERRAEILKANGLQVLGPAGDLPIEERKPVRSPEITAPFDLIILSCKAYDLNDAARSFAASRSGPRPSSCRC